MHDSWEPRESFDPCPHILQEFLDMYEAMRVEVSVLKCVSGVPVCWCVRIGGG